MEKRALLAVVLSFIIIALYFTFFAPPPPKREAPPKREEAVEPREVPPPVAPISPAPAIPPQEIRVETERMAILFTNRGASPVSWRLKDYKDRPGKDGRPVELLGLDPQSDPLPLQVEFLPTPKGRAGQAVYYMSDGKSQVLNPSRPSAQLDFRYQFPDGVRVVKSFQLSYNMYSVPLRLTLTNGGGSPWTKSPVITLARPLPDGDVPMGYVGHIDGKVVRKTLKKVAGEKINASHLLWFAIDEKYFLTALIPKGSGPYKIEVERRAGGVITARLISPPLSLAPGETKAIDFTLFFGPKELKLLKSFQVGLEDSIDLGWLAFIAKPLLYILRFFYDFAGNYGLAIILLTVAIRIVFWPLNEKSFRSMQRMQKLQPLIARLKERYKDDKMRLNKEVMNLYKQYKVSPLGGCLPMLVQIPILYAMYVTLLYAIELRHAPFILWIKDLSAKDPTYITPIVMGGTMFLQQKMTPTTGDPAQAKMMLFMPVIFTVFFLGFPSGLVLYWLVNNLLSIAQQYYSLRRLGLGVKGG